MIIPLIFKDLKLVGRERILRFAFAGYLVVFLSASLIFFYNFLKVGNYPFPAISSILFSRISLLQGALLAALTPWLVLTMHDADLSGDSIPFGTSVIIVPWKILLSKLIASAICVLNLVLLSLPVFSFVRLLGAAGYRQICWVLADTFLFLMVLTVLIFHLRLRCRGWISSWISSYAALGVTGLVWYRIWSNIGSQRCFLIFLLLLVLFVALLFPHGNRALVYERN